MKRFKYVYLLLLAASILSACSADSRRRITVKDKFAMNIPSNMSEITGQVTDATILYATPKEDLCMSVIEDSKAELSEILGAAADSDSLFSLDNFTKVVNANMRLGKEVTSSTEVVIDSINGLPARTFSINITVDNQDAFFFVACIEGKETFYQVQTWTLNSLKSKYEPDMHKIVYSFEEL